MHGVAVLEEMIPEHSGADDDYEDDVLHEVILVGSVRATVAERPHPGHSGQGSPAMPGADGRKP